MRELDLPPGKSAGLSRADGVPLFTLEKIKLNETWSVSANESIPSGSPVRFIGWAVDPAQQTLASAVDIAIDGTAYNADYGISRGDVAAFLKNPAYRDSGFRLVLPAGALAKGHHQAAVRIIATDGKSYWESSPIAFDVQ